MSTNFGVDSSSRFLLECKHRHADTHTVTDSTDHCTLALATFSVGN